MNNIDQIRTVLNVVFLIGAAVSMVLYFVLGGDDRYWFFVVCGISLAVKMMEFVLRFLF
ncbi:MAG: hypothetical protein PUD47_03400 [Bacteroidales bacterium]|nr:hypothetical protein [Bacteroidales bacterium]